MPRFDPTKNKSTYTLTWNTRLPAIVREAAYRGLVKGSQTVRNEVIRRLYRTKKTGRIYWIRGKRHRASAPGEAPAVLSGRHARGITVSVNKRELRLMVRGLVRYTAALEGGTMRIKPRPHLKVSVRTQYKAVTKLVADEIKAVLGDKKKSPFSGKATVS